MKLQDGMRIMGSPLGAPVRELTLHEVAGTWMAYSDRGVGWFLDEIEQPTFKGHKLLEADDPVKLATDGLAQMMDPETGDIDAKKAADKPDDFKKTAADYVKTQFSLDDQDATKVADSVAAESAVTAASGESNPDVAKQILKPFMKQTESVRLMQRAAVLGKLPVDIYEQQLREEIGY